MIKQLFKEFRETAYHQYLWYVLRHKWYVGVECWKGGLYWAAIFHDWSKFLPDEFIPYARHFHGPQAKENLAAEKGKSGYKKPVKTKDPSFDRAWLRHTRRNPHHSEYWAMGKVGEEATPFPMPEKYVREMICDWRGAGRAQNNPTPTHEWYLSNRERLLLHPETESHVETALDLFKYVVGIASTAGLEGETVKIVTVSTGLNKIEVDFKVAKGFTVQIGDLVCFHRKEGTVKPFVNKIFGNYSLGTIERWMIKARERLGIFDDYYLTTFAEYLKSNPKGSVNV